MSIKRIVFFLFNFSIVLLGFSQEKKNQVSLKKVFISVEEKFDVKFSYSERDIHSKMIFLEDENLTLDEILKELKSQTGLIFKKITERYIIVKSIEKLNTKKICGFVYDKFTLKPLVGADVVNEALTVTTITDVNGYFELNNIDVNESVLISFIGYTKMIKAVVAFQNKSCPKLFLSENLSILDEILLNSYLTNGMLKKSDGSEEFLPKKLGILPGLIEPDILQGVQLLPGVLSPDETAAGLHIRGGTPDQNLILFDDIKIYNSAHFFGMISAFNPYFSKRAKVFRSGASAQYGNHISGVIDIKSDDKLADKVSGGFGTNLIHADAFIKFPINDNISVTASGRRSFADALTTITFKNISERVFQNTIVTDKSESEFGIKEVYDTFFYTDINTKILYDINDNNTLSFSFLYNKNKLKYFLEDEGKNFFNTTLNFFNSGVSLKWDKKWSDNVSQLTRMYYSDFDLKYNFNLGNDITTTSSFTKANKIKELNIHSKVDIKLNDKKRISLGYEITRSSVGFRLGVNSINNTENNVYSALKNLNVTHTLFGEVGYKDNDKLRVDLGMRVNYFSLSNDFFISPRLYIQKRIIPNYWVRASIEMKRQNISQLVEPFTELFGLERQVWVLSDNKEVPILKSNQLTFGFTFKKNNWVFDVEAYRKEIDGLTSITKGFKTTTNSEDFNGENLAMGIDFFIKKKWNKYSSSISYSLSNSKFIFKGINNSNQFPGNY
ncbi:carboxypeptidase-like regulatory domain-containing protein, partial [Tenacibaculum sp.]|nr:carboxypeptidase-like regulatory domain-containing protein [Tenacibaculum sp.]